MKRKPSAVSKLIRKSRKLQHERGRDICVEAMKHLADHHNSRSYPDISKKDWGDYLAIRILDALYHLHMILGPLQAVPVLYGFKRGSENRS